MRQVAILGAGPAGLFAALAVEQAGLEPVIFSKGEQSKMFGAMYLHRALPGIGDPLQPDFEIDVIKTGSREGYAYNVYGKKDAECSWDKFDPGVTYGWNLNSAYQLLWDRYKDNMKSFELKPDYVGAIANNYPLVFNSIPANVLCQRTHSFTSQRIWIIHGQGQHLIEGVNDNNIMYYNGVPWDGSFDVGMDDPNWTRIPDNDAGQHMIGFDWYRYSQIDRYQAWEYSREPDWEWQDDVRLRVRHKSEGIKPISTSCNCWMYPNVHRIGRFGCWSKGVLTHHAYETAQAVCREML